MEDWWLGTIGPWPTAASNDLWAGDADHNMRSEFEYGPTRTVLVGTRSINKTC